MGKIGRGNERPSRSARRREPTELYASVLEVVKRHHGVARITRVSYGVGMPVDRLRVLIGHLLDLGLLRSEELEGRPSYDITARGQEFLDTYWKMRGFVEGLDRASAFGSGQASRRVKPAESGPWPPESSPTRPGAPSTG